MGLSLRRATLAVALAVSWLSSACRADHACRPAPAASGASSSVARSSSEYVFATGSTNERVGSVHVVVEGDSLRVRYELAPGFELLNAHVCASTAPFAWTSPGSCPWTADGLAPGTRDYELVIPTRALASGLCDAVLSLQIHGTVRRADGTEAGSAYAGSFRGLVEHRVSCAETPSEAGGPGCRLTQGYWKNHPESWPVMALSIGGVEYDQASLLALFSTPTRGDASLILGHQLIAAELNVKTGGSVPEPAAGALAASRAWMGENADADGRLPYGVFEGDAAFASAVSLSEVLDAFNNDEL